jgi:hypothetical protein
MTGKPNKYAFSLTERNRLKISKSGEPDFDNMVNNPIKFINK